MAETNNAFNVFISWSGPRSKSAAEALKEWLPLVAPTANPWMSATDIDKGARWREEVAAALDTMKAGIICLTPENLTAEWLLFEAGALSKPRDAKNRVWTYLLGGLTIPDLTDPLAMFQATKAEEDDTRKLVHSINTNLDPTVPESRVDRLFDKFWPDLKKDLDAVPAPSGAAPPKRSSNEIAGDTLELLRSVTPLIQEIAAESDYNRRKRLAEDKYWKSIASLPATNVVTYGSLGQLNPGFPVNILDVDTAPRTTMAVRIGPPDVPAQPTPAASTPPPPERTTGLPSSPRKKTHVPRLKRKSDLNSKR
jgi:hypothetical protein